jgi:hypothetical protein
MTINRPTFGRSLTLRGSDLFDTPPIALDPLFAQEPLLAGVTSVCEPFCGRGNLVLAMRKRGIIVHASDISDRGCPDSKVLDFLDMTKRPPNCDILISNCPYNGAMGYIEHALKLEFRVVILLLGVDFVCTEDRRERLHKPGHLRRIHVLAERLQGMHDAAHIAAGGKVASQPLKHAWHVIDRGYVGPATINPVSIRQPFAQMPWQEYGRSPRGEAAIRLPPDPRWLHLDGAAP